MLSIEPKKLVILSLLIVLAAVNTCAYTPALPEISRYFHQSLGKTQGLIVLSLIAHCFAPIFFAAMGNAFSRLRAIHLGLVLCFLGDFLCVFSALNQHFFYLMIGMFCLSFGGNMGMMMSLSLIREQTFEYLEKPITLSLLAFAILPGLAITLAGGLLLVTRWPMIFALLFGYHFFLWRKTPQVIPKDLPSPPVILSLVGLKSKNFWIYVCMASCLTGAMYTFSALSPKIALNELGISPFSFGLWSNLPSLGMLLGNFLALKFAGKKERFFSKDLFWSLFFHALGISLIGLSLLSKQFQTSLFFGGVSLAYLGASILYPLIIAAAMKKSENHASTAGFFTAIHFLLASQWVNLANHLGWNSRHVLMVFYAASILIIWGLYSSLKRDRINFH